MNAKETVGILALELTENSTRDAIVQAFIESVEKTSLPKVRIASLIDELGINRNTFYYHFANKYDVAMYVFRMDIDQALHRDFKDYELVFTQLSVSKKEINLAYFTHVEIGAHTLDISRFERTFTTCLFSRERFYRKLVNFAESEFYNMLIELYTGAIENDIKFVLGGRYMPQPTFEMLARCYAELIVFSARYCLMHGNEVDDLLDEVKNPFWNLSYEALTQGLLSHPIKRPRKE